MNDAARLRVSLRKASILFHIWMRRNFLRFCGVESLFWNPSLNRNERQHHPDSEKHQKTPIPVFLLAPTTSSTGTFLVKRSSRTSELGQPHTTKPQEQGWTQIIWDKIQRRLGWVWLRLRQLFTLQFLSLRICDTMKWEACRGPSDQSL